MIQVSLANSKKISYLKKNLVKHYFASMQKAKLIKSYYIFKKLLEDFSNLYFHWKQGKKPIFNSLICMFSIILAIAIV